MKPSSFPAARMTLDLGSCSHVRQCGDPSLALVRASLINPFTCQSSYSGQLSDAGMLTPCAQVMRCGLAGRRTHRLVPPLAASPGTILLCRVHDAENERKRHCLVPRLRYQQQAIALALDSSDVTDTSAILTRTKRWSKQNCDGLGSNC